MSKEVADTASKEAIAMFYLDLAISTAQDHFDPRDDDEELFREAVKKGIEIAQETLQRENAELKQKVTDGDCFMAFMKDELNRFECCCGKTHEGTPPMMWPELIACIIRKSNESLQAQLNKAEAARDNFYQAISQIRGELAPRPGYGVPKEQQHADDTRAIIKAYKIALETMQEYQFASKEPVGEAQGVEVEEEKDL